MAWGKSWCALALAAVVVASPAQAQFSDGYKFLEAVKKKDGVKVTDMLNEPGTTVINSRDITSGQGALHVVTARRDVTWIRFLTAKGANPNARDKQGVTPLVVASRLGFIEGVDALIEAGAKVDEANDTGETPLIAAVHARSPEMMQTLLKAGADPDRPDNSGRSARDYAQLEGSDFLHTIDKFAKPKAERARTATYGPKF